MKFFSFCKSSLTSLCLASLILASSAGQSQAQPRNEDQAPKADAVPQNFNWAALADRIGRASELKSLHAIIVAQNGMIVLREGFRGHSPEELVNIKSLSKTVLSAVAGAAVDKGVLKGVDQKIAPVLAKNLPSNPDPRMEDITVGDLLSLRAGLEGTSGRNYGAWISSRNWVRFALSQPFVDEPGGEMIYSTGSSHLLSAVLTQVSGQSTAELAQEWLAEPLDIRLPKWERDPQGIFLGGNNMAMSADALLRFGEMYRNGGVYNGTRILPDSWIKASWTPGGRSIHSGHSYGYGWFITEMAGHQVFYGWGYGGQMLYVVPSLALTVVMISDPNQPSGANGYVHSLHDLLAREIIPAARQVSSPLPSDAASAAPIPLQ
jgi:CubicO group peptidase (beta-lactamase class C family)